MRISEQSAEEAKKIIASQYGNDAAIWLFGSRADDRQRGGDVDLYIESASDDLMKKIRCKVALTELFDLKVDLVAGNGEQPIHRIAKSTGIRLQ